MSEFPGIPAKVQRAVAAKGGAIETYAKDGRQVTANLAAPAGKVWSASGTHDLAIDAFTVPSPTLDKYWAGVMGDIEAGLEDCDNGESAGTTNERGRCERCHEEA